VGVPAQDGVVQLRVTGVVCLLLGVALGCSSGSGSSGQSASSATSTPGAGSSSAGSSTPAGSTPAGGSATSGRYTDWLTYHHDAARTGAVTGLPTAGQPHSAWTAALDGAVYGQPLVIDGQVVAATENDSVYALNPRNGRVIWRRHLGSPVPLATLPCGDIDPLGITGTPVYDPRSGLVYVLAEQTGYRFVLYGLDPRTGTRRLTREVTPPGGQPRFQQQRPALALASGRVYIDFGGLDGDCGTYWGSVVAVNTNGTGGQLSYRVPTANRAAIWATPGPVVTARGNLLVSTGNGAATSADQPWDGGDSVIALRPDLHQVGYFAPDSWAADNVSDADLGSMAPALLPDGRFVIAGKNGNAYLVRADRPGGIGGEIASTPVCHGFGGSAVSGNTAYLPCVDGGIAAVRAGANDLSIAWRGPAGSNGPPVLGGGALWTVSWPSGRLYELDPATGHTRGQIDVGTVPHFVSPTLTGNLVLVGTAHGVTAVSS